MEEFPRSKRELSKEEVQDAQIGLLEWELEERDRIHGTDHLTGVSTRKVFEHHLENLLKTQREGEKGQKLALVAIDVDHFKQVNDTFGHSAGDEVLRSVAALLMESVRETDFVGRMGGEEFMILFQGADEIFAKQKSEELRTSVEKLTFNNYPGLEIKASFGVVSSEHSNDATILRERADQALYVAKRSGRNQVKVYSDV